MADYFSSSDSDEEPFYGFLDEELNLELVERRRGVDVEEESDIGINGSSADSLGLSDKGDSERGESNEDIITEEGNWTKYLKDVDNFFEFTSPVGPTNPWVKMQVRLTFSKFSFRRNCTPTSALKRTNMLSTVFGNSFIPNLMSRNRFQKNK